MGDRLSESSQTGTQGYHRVPNGQPQGDVSLHLPLRWSYTVTRFRRASGTGNNQTCSFRAYHSGKCQLDMLSLSIFYYLSSPLIALSFLVKRQVVDFH